MYKIAIALMLAIGIVVSTLPAHAGDAATQAADNNTAASQISTIKKRLLLPPPPTIALPH
jgi:hypothetical protein